MQLHMSKSQACQTSACTQTERLQAGSFRLQEGNWQPCLFSPNTDGFM